MTTGERRRHVEVRRPLHMRRPISVLERRRRKRAGGRRGRDAEAFRHGADSDSDYYTWNRLDLHEIVFVIALFAATASLWLLGPWLLALVAMLLESAVWAASIVVGFAAAGVLRRPYSVAVVDSDTGEVLARTLVTGRAAAELHADVVASRLREGLTPTEATSLDTAPA